MHIKISKTDPVLQIGIVAEKFNISVHTLRLYEAEGLIIPFKTKSGRRLYSTSDINRIACIRKMIDQRGLNIAGIKSLLALIPCWDLLPCSEKDRKNCDAYTNSASPCWTAKNKGEICRVQSCRECHVYQELAHCDDFKEYMKKIFKRGTNE